MRPIVEACPAVDFPRLAPARSLIPTQSEALARGVRKFRRAKRSNLPSRMQREKVRYVSMTHLARIEIPIPAPFHELPCMSDLRASDLIPGRSKFSPESLVKTQGLGGHDGVVK